MRRLLAIAGIAAISALAGVGALAAPAGAGVESAAFTCTFTLSTTSLPAGGGTVQVSGTAPADTPVRIYRGNDLVATVQSSPTDGTWGPVAVDITVSSDIQVSILEDYPATPCLGPGGTQVERVTVAGASAAALAYTGSDHTRTYVLVGASLVVAGVALAVAARRRHYTHGRV